MWNDESLSNRQPLQYTVMKNILYTLPIKKKNVYIIILKFFSLVFSGGEGVENEDLKKSKNSLWLQ